MRGRETASPFQQEQDEWQRKMWEEVALSVGRWLTDAQVDLSRPIRSLKQRELLGMAWAAIAAYHELRARRLRQLEATPDPRRSTLPDAA
jgi:hypothetical protein